MAGDSGTGRRQPGRLMQAVPQIGFVGGYRGDLTAQCCQFLLKFRIHKDKRRHASARVAVTGGDEIVHFRIQFAHRGLQRFTRPLIIV